MVGVALDEEFQLLTGHIACMHVGPPDGPDLLFGSDIGSWVESYVVRELGEAVDIYL